MYSAEWLLISRGLNGLVALCSFQRSDAALFGLSQPNTHLLERVTMAAGIHLFPFRTEKLSPPAPMVLRGRLRGRVGRRPFLLSLSDSQHAARPRQAACQHFSLFL